MNDLEKELDENTSGNVIRPFPDNTAACSENEDAIFKPNFLTPAVTAPNPVSPPLGLASSF